MNHGSVDCWVSECFEAQKKGPEKNQSVRVHVEVCTQGREQRKLRAHEDYTNKMNCYAQSLLNHVAVWVLQNRSYVFDIMSNLHEGDFTLHFITKSHTVFLHFAITSGQITCSYTVVISTSSLVASCCGTDTILVRDLHIASFPKTR